MITMAEDLFIVIYLLCTSALADSHRGSGCSFRTDCSFCSFLYNMLYFCRVSCKCCFTLFSPDLISTCPLCLMVASLQAMWSLQWLFAITHYLSYPGHHVHLQSSVTPFPSTQQHDLLQYDRPNILSPSLFIPSTPAYLSLLTFCRIPPFYTQSSPCQQVAVLLSADFRSSSPSRWLPLNENKPSVEGQKEWIFHIELYDVHTCVMLAETSQQIIPNGDTPPLT